MTLSLRRLLAAWLMMLLVSMANGALREFVYAPYLSASAAQQLSTLTGAILLGIIIYRHVQRHPFPSLGAAFQSGVFWVTLTIAFEFLFFHYVGGHPWSALLANYDLSAGRLWPLLLLWITLAPALFFFLEMRRTGAFARQAPPTRDQAETN
ncbi:hypothetical protein [Propionivibrio dicarboxylicus]|uniref:Uncharacterized protein n=1 Tax=Propionivibrio dicarboxylicus TaxID=83767 RepID=A0A1G8GED6_9RHOO|nr:hypothetical protein [Propionivibrio dicarboxylicus]SDH92710.1 hypothetical protein SAMN05660652_02561 [Propionivibrio dicarboxylicus]